MRTSKRDFLKSIASAFSAPALLKASREGRCEVPESKLQAEVPGVTYGIGDGCFQINEGVQFDSVKYDGKFPRLYFPGEIPFFMAPAGKICPVSGRVKGVEDTSMYMAGSFPLPMVVAVRGLRLYAMTDDETLRKLAPCSLELQILQKVYLRAPLVDLLRKGYPEIAPRACAKPSTGYCWLIPEQGWFSVTVHTPGRIAPVSPTELTVVLDTVEARPIQ